MIFKYYTFAGNVSVCICSVCTKTHLVLGSWELDVTISSWEPSFFKPWGHVLDISLAGSSSATGKQGTCLSSLLALVFEERSLCKVPSWFGGISLWPSELRRSTLTLKSLKSCFAGLGFPAVFFEPDDSTFRILVGFGPSLSSPMSKSPMLLPNFSSKFWWCFSSSNALFQAVDLFIYGR